jgi:hypothetical protein
MLYIQINTTLTDVVLGGTLDWVNNTLEEIYYQQADLDNFTIRLTLNDTIYTELLSDSILEANTTNAIFEISYTKEISNGTYIYEINPLIVGNFSLQFNISLIGYQSQTVEIYIQINTTLTDVVLDGTLDWINNTLEEIYYQQADLDNFTIRLTLNDSIYNELQADSTLEANSTNALFEISYTKEVSNGTYIYEINPLVIGNFTLLFNFSHIGYQNTAILLFIQINRTLTDVVLSGSQYWANNTLEEIYYQQNDLDNFTIRLTLNDTFYNELLTDSSLNANETNSIFEISYRKEVNGTFIFKINPLIVGSFALQFNFSLTGYQYQNVILKIKINSTLTDVVLSGPLYWVNNTLKEVNYQQTDLDNFTIRLTLNDIIYDELLAESSLTANRTNSVFEISFRKEVGNGTYIYEINPLSVGNFTLHFNFNLTGYQNNSAILFIKIATTLTDVILEDSNKWTNDSIHYVYFQKSDLDNLTINLTYNDTIYNQILLNANFSDNLDQFNNIFIYSVEYSAGTYTYTINPNATGFYTVRFNFNQTGYETQIIILYIDVTNDTLTEIIIGGSELWENESIFSFYYQEGSLDNFTILLTYNDTIYNSILFNPTVNANQSNSIFAITETQIINGTFKYTFAPLTTGLYNLVFKFNQSGYQSQTLVLFIEIKTTLTDVFLTGSEIWINESTYSFYYQEYDLDNFTIDLTFNDTIYNQFLINSDLTDNLDQFNTVFIHFVSYSMGTYTYTINPNTTGLYRLEFSYNQTGYESKTIVLNIEIKMTNTSVILGGSEVWLNETTYSFYYQEDTLDNFTLELTFKDTSYDQFLNNSLLTSNNTNNFFNYSFNKAPMTGNYTYEFNPLKVGRYSLLYTFSQIGYETKSILLFIQINAALTEIELDGSETWINESTYSFNYQEYDLDNFTIDLTFNDTIYNQVLINADLTSNLDQYNDLILHSISKMMGTYTFTFNPNTTGLFQLEFTYNQTGYESKTIVLNIDIIMTNTSVILGGSKVWLNETTYSFYYQEDDLDNFSIELTFKDTSYDQFLNNSLLTSNNSVNSFNFSFNKETMTGTYVYEFNPLKVGRYSLLYTFRQTGYEKISILLYININITLTEIVLKESELWINESFYSFFFQESDLDNFTIDLAFNDTINNQILLNANFSDNLALFSSNLIHTFSFSKGFYSYSINPNTIGLYSLIFSFNQTGYKSQSFILNIEINITPAFPTYGGSVSWLNNSIITQTYRETNADQFTLFVNYQDTIYLDNLRATLTNLSFTTDYEFSTTLLTNNSWEIVVNPLKVANSTLILRFSKYGYESFIIFIEIHIVSIKFQIISDLFNETTNELSIYYQRSEIIALSWFDPAFNLFLTNAIPTVSDPNWIQFEEISDGVYYFEVYGHSVDTTIINITINFPLYDPQSFVFTIVGLTLSTDEVSIQFTNGIISSQENISKLGYTLGFELSWIFQDNQSLINRPLWNIAINSTLVTNLTSVGISSTVINQLEDSWSIKIRIILLPKYGYQQGWYTFTVDLTKFGVENKSVTFDLYVQSFDVNILLEYDEDLVPGEEYSIIATLVYTNESTTNTNMTALGLLLKQLSITGTTSLIQQSTASIGDPVEGVSVDFLISANFQNGSTILLRENKTSNFEGKAVYTIPQTITDDIVKINSISVDLIDYPSSDNFQITIESPEIIIPLSQEINPLLYIILIIFIILIISLSVSGWVIRRKQKQAELGEKKPSKKPLKKKISPTQEISPVSKPEPSRGLRKELIRKEDDLKEKEIKQETKSSDPILKESVTPQIQEKKKIDLIDEKREISLIKEKTTKIEPAKTSREIDSKTELKKSLTPSKSFPESLLDTPELSTPDLLLDEESISIEGTLIDISKFKGLGPKTFEILQENSIKTLEDLIKADPKELSKLPRLTYSNIIDWQENAKNLLEM